MNIFAGMTNNSLGSMDRLAFQRYDKNGDGVINYSEYNNFLQVMKLNNGEPIKPTKEVKRGINLEQFDPQGPINFEKNGGFNATKLNIIA